MVLLVSGCVVLVHKQQNDLGTVNYHELSREQIDQTFANYQAMLTSSNVITGLISLASPSVAMAANKTKSSAELIYEQARVIAAPITLERVVIFNIHSCGLQHLAIHLILDSDEYYRRQLILLIYC